MSTTVVVTIGRNIRGKAMPAERWCLFKRRVGAALRQSDARVVQRPFYHTEADQFGEWNGENEGAAAYVAVLPNGAALDRLRVYLLRDAREFQQESIGLIVAPGTDTLIKVDDHD